MLSIMRSLPSFLYIDLLLYNQKGTFLQSNGTAYDTWDLSYEKYLDNQLLHTVSSTALPWSRTESF